MEAEKMDENEWRYHGEGNKSLVVSHRQRCVVLRFLKFPLNRNKTPEEIFHHLQNIVHFCKHIMKQFFGENYVHHGSSQRAFEGGARSFFGPGCISPCTTRKSSTGRHCEEAVETEKNFFFANLTATA
ncbi:Inositol-pentakisphosphate 2-kinase [Varanus komodoensis]|nr:Inositol-pentakisphosphate 2-kinase [Varanus komodoensis]